jgi:polyhydroxybutyrate depolymerase
MRPTTATVALMLAFLIACGGRSQLGSSAPAADTSESEPTLVVRITTEEPAATTPNLVLGPGCGFESDRGISEAWIETYVGPRRYLLYVPLGYDPARPTPLIVNFHGSGNQPEEIFGYSQLWALSDREGFLLLTPQGSSYPPEWDITGVYAENGIDDVSFVISLLDDVESRFCVDVDRVYATGLSNGAEMASQVACVVGERFAAAAPVAGLVYQGCEGLPVPIITFHGTDDYNIPFDFIPGEIALWASYNGCTGDQSIENYTENVERWSYEDCGGNDVVAYIVRGGGHTWPGAEADAGGVGAVTDEISANELMWAFFQGHPKAR